MSLTKCYFADKVSRKVGFHIYAIDYYMLGEWHFVPLRWNWKKKSPFLHLILFMVMYHKFSIKECLYAYIRIKHIKPFDKMQSACYWFFVYIWKYIFGQAEPKSIKNCERWKRVRLIFGKFAHRKWWPVKRNQHSEMTDKHLEWRTNIWEPQTYTLEWQTLAKITDGQTKRVANSIFLKIKIMIKT